MRRFFDSSVLIPAFYKFDAHHEASAQALRVARREDSSCALRTPGEVYAVLTGLPVRARELPALMAWLSWNRYGKD